MLEMSAQTVPAVMKTGNTAGSERRSLANARTRRQRNRDLADRQLSLFMDVEVLESLSSLKSSAGSVFETVVQIDPVYIESIDRPAGDRVHVLDRTANQCGFPMWGDDDINLALHFACGAAKKASATYCCSHMRLAYGKAAA